MAAEGTCLRAPYVSGMSQREMAVCSVIAASGLLCWFASTHTSTPACGAAKNLSVRYGPACKSQDLRELTM